MLEPHRYYYLHNFQRALAWVGGRYGGLLDTAEQGFLAGFAQLPMASQALLVRLLLRRGPWFLEHKLAYAEIPDVRAAAQPLLALGWLDAGRPLRLEDLFVLHTKAELLALFATAGLHGGLRKAQMLQALGGTHAGERTYAEWHPGAAHAAWCVTVGDVCERLRLMFFGNLRQGWSEFVLADLGVFRYEPVPFPAEARAFASRADVDGFLAIARCRQALDDGADPAQLLQAAATCASANPWLELRRAKLLLRIGQACERAQQWALAEQAYAQSRYPGARHRRLRVCERSGRPADAWALAQAAQAAPESEEERQRLARMLPRLARQLGLAPGERPARRSSPPLARADLELERPAAPVAVESLVRAHWHRAAAPVFYVENTLFNTLFGLLCWPAIFAPLPGAFFHPFQSGPADLRSPDFVPRRAHAFAACLALLDTGQHHAAIRQRFAEKHGVQSPFVFWGAVTQELLDLSLACIPAAHLRRVFERLLRDLPGNRAGLPDLVRFWPAEQRYELVEVKGPGDHLQDNQIRWLEFFHAEGIPASVCHVQWQGRSPAHAAPVCTAPVCTAPACAVGEAA
ncbi:MAG: VRR-NUC domain-containing protein [Simplicispira sp.]|nr:VRR-NUC domain-containing protein [Simplicispira sp.]